MNIRTFIAILSAILAIGTTKSQTREAADSLTRELQEIVVNARQPATKLVGSTLVSTIPGTGLANLGNALDVLAQLPMIDVRDNTVSVVGKNNIEIYIDGRPMRDEPELQRILSSDIKRVELLLAPGAAYSSSTGAVLRITTRRNFIEGLSMTDQLRIQRRRKWSAMDYLSLNYRTGRWEFFADGVINRDNTASKGSTANTLTYDGRKTIVGSSQYNSHPTTVATVKGGVDYAGDTYSLGAYYRYNPERGDFKNSGTESADCARAVNREIDRHIRAHSHLASIYFEKTFAEKYRLHFDGDWKRSIARNGVSTSYPDATYPDVSSSDERKSSLWAGKLYMELPLWSGNLTVGTQDSHTRTSLDFRMLNDRVDEYIPSSITDARQTSASLFAQWTRTFGGFSLSAGARYEYADYDFKADGKRDENASRRDHLLTPDVSLGYSFGNEAQVSLSYKMATVKPPYSQLTGSLNYVGVHEIEGGNPALRDGRMLDLQLFAMWKGFMFQADFTRSLDTYAYVKQLYPTDNLQLLMHPVNIDVSALSLYLIWSRPIGRWTPNATAGIYRQWLLIDNARYDKPIFSYYFDNTFSLPRGWTLTANLSGRTRGDMHTNRFAATWLTLDASVGKTFFDKSLTVKLSATDIFNTANNNWTMDTFGVFVDKRQSYDQRGVALNIIYSFQPRKSRYKGTAASAAELKRL